MSIPKSLHVILMSEFQGCEFSSRKPKALSCSIFFHNTIATNTYKRPFGRILFVFCVAGIHCREALTTVPETCYNRCYIVSPQKATQRRQRNVIFIFFMDGKTSTKRLWILLGHARSTLQSLEVV